MTDTKIDKSFLVIVLFLIITGYFTWTFYLKEFHQTDTVNIHHFPRHIGKWTSQDLIITEDEYKILETRNAFIRRYQHPEGGDLYLLLVYSQHNRKVSHPPEICYVGSGAQILEKSIVSLSLGEGFRPINTNRLVLEYGNTRQISYYWFKVGRLFTPSYWRQQVLYALKAISGKPPSSALVRMAVTFNDVEDSENAAETVKQFSRLIMPLLQEYLP
jgi:EpsI family protein